MSAVNVYVSMPAWLAISTWAAGVAHSLGDYLRNQNPPLFAAWSGFEGAGVQQVTANFGGTAFNMAAPSGYSAWGSTDTWNPSDKNTNITLTNGNLTAAMSAGGNWFGVRTVGAHNSGKWYFEMTVDTKNGSTVQTYGIANKNYNVNSNWLAQDTTASGGYMDSTSFSTAYPWQGVAATQTLGIAVDIDAGLIWARTSANGNWNNSSSANPATGVGGDSITSFSLLTVGNERVFKCTTAGTTGTGEPSWNLGNNATTTDNTATWTQVAGQEAEQVAGNWKAPLANIGTAAGLISGAGGVVVYTSSDHVENYIAGDYSVGSGNVSAYVSVNRSTGSIPPAVADYTAGATVKTTGNHNLSIQTGAYFGFTFVCADTGTGNQNLNCGTTNGHNVWLENCKLQLNSTGSGSTISVGTDAGFPGSTTWRNTTVKFASTGHIIVLEADPFEWSDTASAIDTAGTIPSVLFNAGPGGWTAAPSWVRGVDLSALNTRLFANNGGPQQTMRLDDCKLSSSLTWPNGVAPTPYGGVKINNCDAAGGINYRAFWRMATAQLSTSGAMAVVGGAVAGGVNYSHRIDVYNGTNAASPFQGPWIQRRYNTTGVAKNVTVECITFGSALPTSIQTWMEVEVLEDSGGSPLCSLHTSRPVVPIVGTTNTSSTADWTGGSLAAARQNSHAYAVDDVVTVTDNTGIAFRCTGAGTSASAEPGGYATATEGSSVTDGTATFTVGRRFKLQLTVTPHVAGIIRARVCASGGDLGGGSNFYFFYDPKLSIA